MKAKAKIAAWVALGLALAGCVPAVGAELGAAEIRHGDMRPSYAVSTNAWLSVSNKVMAAVADKQDKLSYDEDKNIYDISVTFASDALDAGEAEYAQRSGTANEAAYASLAKSTIGKEYAIGDSIESLNSKKADATLVDARYEAITNSVNSLAATDSIIKEQLNEVATNVNALITDVSHRATKSALEAAAVAATNYTDAVAEGKQDKLPYTEYGVYSIDVNKADNATYAEAAAYASYATGAESATNDDNKENIIKTYLRKDGTNAVIGVATNSAKAYTDEAVFALAETVDAKADTATVNALSARLAEIEAALTAATNRIATLEGANDILEDL